MSRPFNQEQLQIRPGSREEAGVKGVRGHFERTLVQVRGELARSIDALEHLRRSEAVMV